MNAAVQQTKKRDGSLDLMRGLAIMLVILFHASTVLRADMDVPSWLQTFNAVFAPVRMPAMVFLSGLLVAPSIKKGTAPYLTGKARRILWPYVLWSVGFVVLLAVAAPEKYSLSRLVTVPIDPVEHLWFLYYLMGYYFVALLTLRMRAEVIAGAFLVVNVIGSVTGLSDLQIFGFLGCFFFMGVACSWHPEGLVFLLRQGWAAILGAACLICMVALGLVAGEVRYFWYLAPFVFFLVVAGLRLARKLSPQRWTTPFKYLGVESLVFYIAHYPVMIIVANLAKRASDNGPLLVIIVIAAGFLIPWGLSAVTRRVPVTRWIFEFHPSTARARSASRLPS
ncbi:acyltransferase family protein [Microbacterium lushaniae]|uniref:Acyltransferase n=1 Tax=Microbacterium lushaniae TaxID=2614639 RepID=A0A5J6L108_9MICO|nr:acyltransferase [Microbacterium lushaniae]QEW02151.1 acyltransferase [Microbacterium lushaniae]